MGQYMNVGGRHDEWGAYGRGESHMYVRERHAGGKESTAAQEDGCMAGRRLR